MVEVSDSDKVVPTADVESVEVVESIHLSMSSEYNVLRPKAEQFDESHKQHSAIF